MRTHSYTHSTRQKQWHLWIGARTGESDRKLRRYRLVARNVAMKLTRSGRCLSLHEVLIMHTPRPALASTRGGGRPSIAPNACIRFCDYIRSEHISPNEFRLLRFWVLGGWARQEGGTEEREYAYLVSGARRPRRHGDGLETWRTAAGAQTSPGDWARGRARARAGEWRREGRAAP